MDLQASDTLTEDDIEAEVYEAADQIGVEIDEILIYESVRGAITVRAIKDAGKSADTEKYVCEFTEKIDRLTDDNGSLSIMAGRQMNDLIRALKEEIITEMKVNDHILRFQMDDGFEVTDLATGMELSYSPADYKHSGRGLEMVEDIESLPCVSSADVKGIPRSVKEELFWYVVGWALEWDPQEWKRTMNVDDLDDWKI